MKAICTECKNEYTEWIGGDNTCPECEEIVNIYIPKETLDNIIKDINKIKEETQTQTGSFKYDVCYEECVEVIEKYK